MCCLLLESCKSTECFQKEQRYYIKDIAPNWPFVLKINWWTPAGTWNNDTLTVDSNGIIQKRIRFIMQSAQSSGSCPSIYGEQLKLEYSEPNPNNQNYPGYGFPWFVMSPYFTFVNVNPYDPNAGSTLLIDNLPVDTGLGNTYKAIYNLNNLTFQKLQTTQEIGDLGYKTEPPATSTPQNAVKVNSIQSFGKTYYNVWKFPVTISQYPKGYKNLYFDPANGLIKYELNNGTIVDIQP